MWQSKYLNTIKETYKYGGKGQSANQAPLVGPEIS